MAVSKPVKLSTGDENVLYAPVSTVTQNLVLSFSTTHIPGTSLRPFRLMPMTMYYTAFFTICPSLWTW